MTRRLLICAFGPFPGVAANPAEAIARALGRRRWPGDIAVAVEILPTRWAVLRRLPALLGRHAPDGVLLLGVAARRRALCVETRAVNRATDRPDAIRAHPDHHQLVAGGPAVRRTTARPRPLLAAARAAFTPARLSRDAGRYLCNASYFIALESLPAVPVVFVHVPGLPRGSQRPPAGLTRACAGVVTALAAQARRW